LKRGDVFLGMLDGCQKGKNTGLRIEIKAWPGSANVGFFPLPHWNSHILKFDKPSHRLVGSWPAHGGFGGAGLRFLRADRSRVGSLLAFDLEGKMESDALRGELLWAGQAKAGPAHVPQNLQDYPFFCSSFSATRCTREPPRPGEKVVVFMRHGAAGCDAMGVGRDPSLTALGKEQVGERMLDPNLLRVLSQKRKEQAQVILVSPLARAMHTALLAFSSRLPKVKWELDPNLAELGGVGAILPTNGQMLLRSFNATGLLEQYRAVAGSLADFQPPSRHMHHEHRDHHSHHNHSKLFSRDLDKAWLDSMQAALEAEPLAALGATSGVWAEAQAGPELMERFQRFTKRVLERKETRIVAVSHKHILKAGLGVSLEQTQTVVMALSPSGEWRQLDTPRCWPEAAG